MSALLKIVGQAERVFAILAFAIMAIALLADVISRKLFQTGLIGATEVAVFGMVALAMFGIGIATDSGAHFRTNFLDGVVPERLRPAVNRVASVITAIFFVIFAVLSVIMVWESVNLGDRTAILRVPVWALQLIVLVGFATNAVRYGVYALKPELKPDDRPGETAQEAS